VEVKSVYNYSAQNDYIRQYKIPTTLHGLRFTCTQIGLYTQITCETTVYLDCLGVMRLIINMCVYAVWRIR